MSDQENSKQSILINQFLLTIGLAFLLGLSVSVEFSLAQSNNEIINFSARDSLLIDLTNGRIATLFGNAKVEHPSAELTAGKITLDMNRNLATAEATRLPIDTDDSSNLFIRWLERKGDYYAPVDTLSMPTLRRDGDDVRSRRIQFNYVTERGRFDVAEVSLDQGNVTGSAVKNPAPHVVFIEDGMFSTCELEHPHYYIRASRMKVVDEDEVFFTNARLFILDIPYPFIFPFGYVPSRIQRNRSGFLEPRLAFQDQSTRGLGIENIGWFQYFNDYLAGSIAASLFTSATYFTDADLQYALRDRYRGSIRVGYSREQGLEPTDPDFSRLVNSRLEINHQQTFNPYASGTANINLRTSDYFLRNSYDISDRSETSTSSRASFNYRQPDGIYTLGISMQQSQNFANNTVQLQGPNANYSFRRLNPFQSGRRGGDQRWYETLAIGYGGQFSGRFDYRPILDPESGDPVEDINWIQALFNPEKHREATGSLDHIRLGFTHRADITTQLSTSDFLNITTNARYNEFWYPETVRKEFDEEENRIVDRIEPGIASARTFNLSLNFGTTLYGISNARIGSLQGFRHTMRPNLSLSYQPDFTDDFWGYFREVQTDTLGNSTQYSIFERGILGGPSAGEQRNINFGLSNVFETKQVRRDTTGERSERVIRIIDDLRANMSYNLAAEQFKLSDLSTSLSSNILQNIRINANATFSFYDQDSLGRAIDSYRFDNGNYLPRLVALNINASTTLSPGSGGAPSFRPGPSYHPWFYDPFDQSIFRNFDHRFNQMPGMPFNVPWSASVRFSYSWRFIDFNNTQKSTILNVDNLQFRLTEGWSVGTSIGYDFIRKELTPSRFSLARDLHCWRMSFEWNPFGDFQFFMFSLSVNDSQMRSLFQMLPGLNNLERRSSPIGRR